MTRTVALKTVAPGARVSVPGTALRGTVRHIGIGSVLVDLAAAPRTVSFEDRWGTKRQFESTSSRTVAWSLETRVVQEDA